MTVDKAAAEKALEMVRMTQTAFWDAMNELENELGGADLDSSRDYSEMTIEDLLGEESGPTNCAKCGKPIDSESISYFDVDGMGKKWDYCSMECRDRH